MTELKNLRLDEVSLVDEGANPGAKIVLMKRRRRVRKAENDVEALLERIAELEAEVARLRDEATEDVTEATEGAPAKETAAEKKYRELTARMEEHIREADAAKYKLIATRYEILGEDAEDLAHILESAKGTPVYDKLLESLERELELVQKTRKFGEIGKSGYGTPAGSIERIAAQIRKREPSLSYYEAIDRAFDTHPELKY